MNDSELKDLVNALSTIGWAVQWQFDAQGVPTSIAQRYSWLPNEVVDILQQLHMAVATDQKAWFITCHILSGRSNAAFRWNQWETDSLAAAMGDKDWQDSIRDFWDSHFTLLMSVRNGYGYIAIRKGDNAIVAGEEPEYEETRRVAKDLAELVNKLILGDPAVADFV